jgi:hypothetical protein
VGCGAVAPDKDLKPKYTERLNGPIQSTSGDILYLTLQKLAADLCPERHPPQPKGARLVA